MRTMGTLFLAVLLGAPALLSAQGMGHQHQSGQQQMQHMAEMEQMLQTMAAVHEQLQGLHRQMGQEMGQMARMTEAQHIQHMQLQGMTEAMGEVAGQMHSAMQRMMEMARESGLHQDPSMREDMEALHGHMKGMTESLSASLEVMQRLHRRTGGGGEGR